MQSDSFCSADAPLWVLMANRRLRQRAGDLLVGAGLPALDAGVLPIKKPPLNPTVTRV